MLRPDQILLVYDGECRFCSGVARTLRRLDWRDRIVALPYQTRGLPRAVGVSEKRAEQSALVLSPSGRLWSEGGAIASCFDALLPRGLPLFRGLYLIPGLHGLADATYRFLARNRGKVGLGRADLQEGERPELDPAAETELRRRRLASRMPSALPGPPLGKRVARTSRAQ